MRTKLNTSKIKTWREERCWSQEHVAEISGISLRTVQRIENGAAASRESVMALAAAFNVDASALMLDIDGEVEKAVAREEERKQLQFKLSFWIHFATYAFVMAVLVMINLAKTPEEFWVLWPAIGWGIGVLAHGATVFIVGYVAKTQEQINALDS